MSDIDAFLDGPGTTNQPESQIDSFLGKPEGSGIARRVLGDTGVSLMKGLAAVPEMAVGLADIPTGGRAGKLVDDSVLVGFKGVQDYWGEMYSPEQKAANASVQGADGFGATIGQIVENPSVVPHAVVESLPSMVAGGVIGKGLKAAPLIGQKISSLAAGAIGEGAVMAGSAAEGTRQQTDDGLLTPKQQLAAAGTGALGAVVGVGGAKIARGLGLGDVDTAMVDGALGASSRGMPARIAGGAAIEGGEELLQSSGEVVSQNYALDRELTDGLGNAAAMGLATGGAMGAGFGALSGRGSDLVQPIPSAENPAPIPVPRPDPNAGAISRTAALLPAPSIAGRLPAPDTFYADSQGNVNSTGPVRNVDGTLQPDTQARPSWVNPGNAPSTGGSGMDQQTERGGQPGREGDYIPASRFADSQKPQSQTIDGELARDPQRLGAPAARIADTRAEVLMVDGQGNATPGRVPSGAPTNYVQGGPGMDQQREVGKTYKGLPAANRAIRNAKNPGELEAVRVGPKTFEVRAKPVQKKRIVNRDRDSLTHAVTRLGGIKTNFRQDTTGDSKGNKFLPGVGALWSDKTGTSLDDMASLLDQHGYVPAGEMDRDGGVSWLQAALRDEASGVKKHAAPGSKLQEEISLKAEAQRQADIAAQEEAGGDFDSAASIKSDLLDDSDILEIRATRAAEFAAELDALFEDNSNETVASTQGGDSNPAATQRAEVEASGSVGAGEQGALRRPDARAEGEDQVAPALELRSQTEQELAQQADAQAAARAAEAATVKAEQDKAQADKDRNDFTLTGSDRVSDVAAARGQNDMFAPPTRGQAKPAAKVEDFGEKIGGARKDTSTPGKKKAAKEADSRPAWQRRYEVTQVVTSTVPGEAGRWVISDTRKLDWKKQPKQLRGNYATEEEAMQMLPVIAVAQKHRVLSVRDGDGTGFEIWRDVTDRKRVKVVDQVFPSREAGMEYMARNAKAIIETNTTFGEADLPRPDSTVRKGAERRTGPVKDSAFTEAFGFRGVEFGNWNNQEERQQLLDDAYDGLMDLAEVMDIPPRAISLNGDLALAFGARGQGLSGARAHYEPGKVVINLTKLNGAGSLAHEWFHALDHYFARQDGKSSSAWAVDKDGTRALKISSNFESDAASSGFLRNNSGVREVLRDAYTDLMKTMFSKGETYVEDTARVDEFVGRSRKELADRLDEIRRDLAEQKDPTYWKRNNKPASAEQLAEFDTVAQLVRDGTALSTELRPTPGKSRSVLTSMRWTNDALEKMSEIYKAVRGRTGFNAENNGVFDRLRQRMSAYSSRLKMLADAQNGEEKVKKVPTQFAMDAKELDQGRGTDYWTTPHEMAARAFQGYVEDKVAERGGQSPFLNFGPENVGILTPWGWKRPFPAGEERQSINNAFDKLIGVIQTRETEGGKVALYSRASYRQGQAGEGSRAVPLRLQLKRLTGGWQNAPDIKVVQSVKDLPDAQRRQVERDGAFDVEGMFADGQVYLVADNLRDVKHAAFVMQHEVLGHAGLQGAYGRRLKPLLMSLYNGNADLKSQADALVKQFNYDPAVAMEEVLADMAAADIIKDQAFWPRLVAAMRNAMRSIGMGLTWSEGDIQALLANARRYIKSGTRKGRGRSVYSRNGSSGRMVEMLDEQGRLLAPNGKPSKLNQKQWHQARSQNFKRWFGDWQAASVQERLDAMKPLKLRMPEAWKGLTERERLAKVEESLKGMARASEALPHQDLGEVVMGMSGAKKSASSAADPAKQAILARLQSAFEHSIYASSSLSTQNGQTAAYHKMLAPIDVDGVPLVAVFTVREDVNGRMFYNTVAVDRKENALAVSPGDMRQAQGSLPANTKALDTFVRQPLKRVNPADVSKVTDANGEPQVLYHGTAEQFTVFDQSRAGRSTGHATAPLGIFLTADGTLAKAYAEKATDGMPGLANVMPLFASIKKPYQMTLAESQALDTNQKAIAMRQKLESEGYDGIQLQGSPVWVAFYNSQVKSATNNTGAFDEVDPDIRYSRAGYARDLFNRATGPAPLERNDPFAAENRRLREGEQTLWQKAKKQFARQFAPGGLLPDAVFAEKITRDSEFQAVEFDVRHLSSGLNKAVKDDFGVDLDNLAAEQMKPLAEALAGKVDPTIPEATRVAIVAMRQYIDSLSGEFLSILQKQVEANMEGADQALIDKITGNLGSYVNRSYQAFDDPKWFKTVPTEVVNAARVYLAKGYVEQGETAAEAARLADVTVNEMLKNGTAYDSMGGFIAESKLGAKDLTVLIKRKEIAPEIRALLGEYMDPRLNFAKSATKMGRMVWNQRFLDRVLEFGMGTLFFEGKNRPADATTQIAGEQSESYAPLNGLWTFPEVAQSFQDALGKEQMSDLYRTVVRLNGMVKYGKTILSPTTAMRNWQSAMFFSLANGHFDLTQMKKSWAALREQVTQSATGEDLTYLRKLKQLGVVYDTPYAGEMMALMNDARMDELLSSKSGTGLKWLRKANQFAQGFYSFGDDFWKIIGYENEKASLVAAGIPVAEAETMAAERIRNTYPTYSMIGKAVQWLRRFPLAGTFVSFPSEIIRTTVGMMKVVNADLKSDNPKIRALGRKRAAGMAMVSAGFYALSAMTAAALGVGDDEEEALRDLAAPWSKNSTFLYTGRDADGKLRYFDMSFLDPYGYWKRPLTAMMRDQPWEDAAASGISDMLSPFFGADITAGAIFEVLANKKPTGSQVYNENAGTVDQLQDISNHMRKALQPGFVSNAERLWLAGSEARREGSGQPYDMRDEVVSLLGWRAATLDTQTGLYYRSFDFTDALSDAKKTLTRTLRSSNDVSEGDIRESKQAANAQYQKAFTEMGRLVSSAGTAGMSRGEIVQTLKLSGVSQRNIFALMNGRVPPIDIGMQSQAKAVRQARAMRDSEHAAEIARRFRLAREQP